MADYSVSTSSSNNFGVTVQSSESFSVHREITTVSQLSDLSDVNAGDLTTKGNHVLIYNATLSKYELVPADQVITSSAADSDIPDSFVEILKTDLDNEIDVDGGSF